MNTKKTLTLLTGAAIAGSMPASAALVVGWDNAWTSPANATQESFAEGTMVSTGWGGQFRGGHNDGTFGSEISGASTTIGNDSSFHNTGLRATTVNSATIDVTITDTSGLDRDLTSFNFDSVLRNGSATGSYSLSIVSGDLTSGAVAGGSGSLVNSFTQHDLTDHDIDLTGLTDNTLDANGSVTFRLDFTVTGAAKSIDLDNLAIGGTPVPEPSSTALLGLGGIALILRRRK